MGKIKILLICVLVLCAIMTDISSSAAQATYKLRAVTVLRQGPHFPIWQWMADEIEKRTNGQVKTEVFSLPELGLTGFELLRVTKGGMVDFVDIPLVYAANDIPLLEGVTMPGMYPNMETALKANSGFLPFARKQGDKIGGIVIGGYLWANQCVFSKKPVRSLEDLKGLKVRISNSKNMDEYFRALGASPIPLPLAEVYTGIERGSVDACNTGSSAGFSLKFYEVTKYLIDVNYGMELGINVVSKKTWDKFPKDIQQIILKVGEEFTEKGLAVGPKATEDGINDCRGKGMEWIPAGPVIKAAGLDAAKNKIIPGWIQRSGPEAKQVFNEYLSPYAGFKIP